MPDIEERLVTLLARVVRVQEQHQELLQMLVQALGGKQLPGNRELSESLDRHAAALKDMMDRGEAWKKEALGRAERARDELRKQRKEREAG